MQEWDGLSTTSTPSGPVVVIGATNRPSNIDSAVLRRLSVTIEVKMPDVDGRLDILQKLLQHKRLSPFVDLQEIALKTELYCGSDLRGAYEYYTLYTLFIG